MNRFKWRRLGCLAVTAALAAALPLSSATASPRGAFPTTVRAANGAVKIASRPPRIVSLSATATEDLYVVGAGHQVVAVDSYSTYPKQAPRTSLSGFSPNVEAIAKYRPALVIVSDDTSHIVSQLGRLGMAVLVEPPANTLSDAYAEIEQIAQATGHAAAGAGVVSSIRRQIAAIARSVPRPKSPLAVYHELDQTFYSASSRTFIGQIYSLFGLKNIADSATGSGTYPQLSSEYIIASDPNLIVLADTVCCGQSMTTVAARPGWSNIAAVKSGAVLAVDDSVASEWGPRIVLFAKAVAGAVKGLEAQAR